MGQACYKFRRPKTGKINSVKGKTKSATIKSEPSDRETQGIQVYSLIAQLAKEDAVKTLKVKNHESIQRVDKLLQEIQAEQPSPFPLAYEVEREAAIPAFIRWCDANDVWYSGIDLKAQSDVGLGLFATTDLEPDQEVMRVPQRLMIDSEDCNNRLGYLIPEGWKDPWNMLSMAIHLIIERKSRTSTYLPYLDILPHDMVHPHYFEAIEFEFLTGSSVHQRCLERWLWLISRYCATYMYVANLIEEGYDLPITMADLSYDAFRWGFSIASTRTVITKRYTEADSNEAGTEGSTSLVPFWDMCNNGIPSVKTYTQDEGDSSAWTVKPHKLGEQLFIEYNRDAHTRTHFGLWGIVCPGNTFNPITMTLKEHGQCFKEKLKTLEALSLGTTRNLTIHQYGDVPLSNDDLLFLTIINLGTKDCKWPLEGEIEASSWQRGLLLLAMNLEKLVKEYKYKIPECKKLMQENSEMENPRPLTSLALAQVQKEQEILQAAKDKFTDLAYKSRSEITNLLNLDTFKQIIEAKEAKAVAI